MASEIGANNYTQGPPAMYLLSNDTFLDSFNTNNLFRGYCFHLETNNKIKC